MAEVRIGRRVVSDATPPFIIAECCNNHMGNLNVALKMVDCAYDIGADAVKFQMRYGDNYLKPEDQYKVLQHCIDVGIAHGITVFDTRSLREIDGWPTNFVKIGSAEWVNFRFVKTVLKTIHSQPVIISTGGGYEEDLERLSGILEKWTNIPVIVMHCTSIYPCAPGYVNIDLISDYITDYFPRNLVGYSDHTKGNEAAVMAIALGARVIEKHFTLSRFLPGPDQEVSLAVPEMGLFIESCRDAKRMLGGTIKQCYPEEAEKLSKWRGEKYAS